jgi:hypothetical protein
LGEVSAARPMARKRHSSRRYLHTVLASVTCLLGMGALVLTIVGFGRSLGDRIRFGTRLGENHWIDVLSSSGCVGIVVLHSGDSELLDAMDRGCAYENTFRFPPTPMCWHAQTHPDDATAYATDCREPGDIKSWQDYDRLVGIETFDLYCPGIALAALLLIPPVSVSIRLCVRDVARWRRNECQRCGYCLRWNNHNVCPECGKAYDRLSCGWSPAGRGNQT